VPETTSRERSGGEASVRQADRNPL